MGLSCKQISSDGLDWSKTLLQPPTIELPKPTSGRRQPPQNFPATEPVNCPRCHSTNTKFCYYNNYNKSQPRHYCKACKRHWTKGGTLQNVPVGGGQKNNKRLKPSQKSAKTAANKSCLPQSKGNIINTVNPQMVIQAQHQKNTSETMSQPEISPPATVSQQNFSAGKDPNSIFLGSNFLQFPYSSSNFETNPFSISTSLIRSSDDFNFSGRGEIMEDSIVTGILSNTSNVLVPQPWQGPNSSYWGDLDIFAPTDFNIPWDDSELKP